ncbi:MAG: N-acetyltransferase [Chloroflexota bacterium]|nr:N-acetyltransferase [Chloroflexota bacterium]
MRALSARPATEHDAEDVARIWNEGIEDRVATFETEPRTADGIARWMRDKEPRYPTVVVERDGRVVAWAAASTYRPRACYDGVGELSVYVARHARGQGAGRAAMEALTAVAAERGLWKLVSRVFPENTASLGLLRSVGFREVGVYRRHAKLDGAWRDVVIVERLVGEGERGTR